MKNIISIKLTIIAIALLIPGMFSCKKENLNLNNLNETIYVRHKGADMPAHIHGNGSEKVFLIVLHGGPGGDALQYRVTSIKSEIEKNNAVVYFDQRGSGNSQGNYSEEELSLDLMAEDILALAKVIRAKYGNDSKLFLMGHSWGGTLGPAVLLKDQSEFLGWINVDGSHDPKGEYNAYRNRLNQIANDQIAIGNSVDYWQNVIGLVKKTDTNYNSNDYSILNTNAGLGEAKLVSDKVIKEMETNDNFPTYNFLTYRWNLVKTNTILFDKKGVYEKVSFTERLSEITIPSIVLFGKYDIMVPIVFAQESYDKIGSIDKELFFFEKSGHSPMLTEPNLFADKVIGFINKHK